MGHILRTDQSTPQSAHWKSKGGTWWAHCYSMGRL